MILELDVGNSRIKWRQWEENTSTVQLEGAAADLAELFQQLQLDESPESVRLCSVRNPESTERIVEFIAYQWNLPVQIAKVTQSHAGVTNQYDDVSKLGVDRWLAMLAAFHRAKGACVIVDSGTAVTIDVLDARGMHNGGFILPGLKLMGDSLEGNTGIRLSAQESVDSVLLGHSTDSAVRNAAMAAVISLIRRVLNELCPSGESVGLFLSGGDAERLAANLADVDPQVRSGLVMEGLAIACPADAQR